MLHIMAQYIIYIYLPYYYHLFDLRVGGCYSHELNKKWGGVIDLTNEFPERCINQTQSYMLGEFTCPSLRTSTNISTNIFT